MRRSILMIAVLIYDLCFYGFYGGSPLIFVSGAMGQEIFLYAADADVRSILLALSRVVQKNMVISPDVSGKLSIRARANFEDIKRAIEEAVQLRFHEVEREIVVVPKTKVADTRVIKLRFQTSKNVAGAVAHLGVRASAVGHDLVFIEGEHERVQLAERVILEMDREPKQIVIEAKIVELTTKGAKELGNFLRAQSGDLEGGFDLLTGKVFVRISPASIDYIIGMLERRGDARTLSSPRILTTDGERAEIRQGISIPYDVSTQFTLNTVFYDAFLSLEVIPKIAEGSVILETKISKNFPTFEVVSARGVPAISKNEIVSKIVTQDGQTVTIGGIIIDTNSEAYEGVPFLSSIPVLGFLFKNYRKMDEKREIAVFLRASVLGNQELMDSSH